jgi:SNF2 family DNA or RNA helicase
MSEIPFKENDWVSFINEPSKKGQYTGRYNKMGTNYFIEIRLPNGEITNKPLRALEPLVGKKQIIDNLLEARFGGINDFRRCITFEKLKGCLHEVLYSMESSQIDFYPYQFKPVLKFINSPTDRLILADEVGLGKTIEATLIWLELQARRNARRLLIVCPGILADKWHNELRYKFMIDAKVAKFNDLMQEIHEVKTLGPGHSFALIATYSGLRSPKNELRMLDKLDFDHKQAHPKTAFLHSMRHWEDQAPPFDLVIFDEAHYMRNPATSVFHMGEALSASAGAVLCVSATPVNNSNKDLHSLLRLIDEDFFETQEQFDELLHANRPAVIASNLLAKKPIDLQHLHLAIEGMEQNTSINNSPIFKDVKEMMLNPNIDDKSFIIKLQDNIEKLNLLGNYINRTRRVQVAERRAIREPRVISVEYTDEEATLYSTILKLVRKKCFKEKRPFHIFKILGLQLRAASCLPAMASEIKTGIHGDLDDLVSDALYYESNGDWEEEFREEYNLSELRISDYNFEHHDSKYSALLDMLEKTETNEKIVIFAYYRSTLSYLSRRLTADGYKNSAIHGGIDNTSRWVAIENFKESQDVKILLSSEVGSEGIDLQFCRILVNYDLPWNPMRVEQRIGRIDRVGQKHEKLLIFNFKVKNTVEERLYESLHGKLNMFSSSLGDFEAVIGEEVQKLTVELLSKELTPDQESRLIEQTNHAIQNKINIMSTLEEKGDALVAFSDYVQQKIQEMKDEGKYITPIELEDYVKDFFQREFQGCEIVESSPAKGCMSLKLTQEAYLSLNKFIADDKSLMAQQLRAKSLTITFDREVKQSLGSSHKKVVFITHLSPFIKWITDHNSQQETNFHNVCALECKSDGIEPGIYCFLIERWRFSGISKREQLAYAIEPIEERNKSFYNQEAEFIINKILRQSKTYKYVDINNHNLKLTYKKLEKNLFNLFGNKYESFEKDNTTIYEIKKSRVENHYDKRIASAKQALITMQENKRTENMIKLTKPRIASEEQNKKNKLDQLTAKTNPDAEQTQVLAGLILINQ